MHKNKHSDKKDMIHLLRNTLTKKRINKMILLEEKAVIIIVIYIREIILVVVIKIMMVDSRQNSLINLLVRRIRI